MARPIKQGIDYFPIDTDFLSDIKVRKIMRACRNEPIGILISILSNIYRDNGYFIPIDDDFYFLVADEIGVQEEDVKEVVGKAVEVQLFHPEKFHTYKILTSQGIQKRYIKACEKRKRVEIEEAYSLLGDGEDKGNIILVNGVIKEEVTQVNGVDNSVNGVRSTQSKVKERKGKDSKVNNHNGDDLRIKKVFQFFEQNIGIASSYIQEELIHWIKDIDDEVVLEAIKVSVDMNIKNYSYINGVLKNWVSRGVKSISDVRALQVEHENKKKQSNGSRRHNTYQEPIPESMKQKHEPQEEVALESEEELKARLKELIGD